MKNFLQSGEIILEWVESWDLLPCVTAFDTSENLRSFPSIYFVSKKIIATGDHTNIWCSLIPTEEAARCSLEKQKLLATCCTKCDILTFSIELNNLLYMLYHVWSHSGPQRSTKETSAGFTSFFFFLDRYLKDRILQT